MLHKIKGFVEMEDDDSAISKLNSHFMFIDRHSSMLKGVLKAYSIELHHCDLYKTIHTYRRVVSHHLLKYKAEARVIDDLQMSTHTRRSLIL